MAHGMYGTPTYKSWQKMKERCMNPNSNRYALYGGKGVKVCERWMVFENFFEDMGVRPDGTSLDRWPDRNGMYEPGNCRWATNREQERNRNTTRFLTIGGVTKSAADWADEAGIKLCTLLARIDDSGMAPQLAIEHKKGSIFKKRDESKVFHHRGSGHPNSKINEEIAKAIFDNKEGMTQKELASRYGVSRHVVGMIKRGKRWKHVTQPLTMTSE